MENTKNLPKCQTTPVCWLPPATAACRNASHWHIALEDKDEDDDDSDDDIHEKWSNIDLTLLNVAHAIVLLTCVLVLSKFLEILSNSHWFL